MVHSDHSGALSPMPRIRVHADSDRQPRTQCTESAEDCHLACCGENHCRSFASDDINSKVLGFAFGLMAEIERNLISMRTKEALERRRKEGKHLGRKKGDTPKMKILYANKRKLVMRSAAPAGRAGMFWNYLYTKRGALSRRLHRI